MNSFQTNTENSDAHRRERERVSIRDEILRLTDGGYSVFKKYLKPCGKKFRNPLYSDKNASVSLFKGRNGKYIMKDWGELDQSGDCFWLVGELNGIDCSSQDGFIRIAKIICSELCLHVDGLYDYDCSAAPLRPSQSKSSAPVAKPEEIPRPVASSKIQYVEEPWTKWSLEYWQRYGIKEETLKRYGVCSIGAITFTGSSKPYTIYPDSKEPAFAYKGDNFEKIYRPFSNIRFMFARKETHEYCFGWNQLPETGTLVVITGGEKDVLSLAQRGCPAIALNSETASLPKDTIEELKRRFQTVAVMYDCDDTGKRAMQAAKTEFDLVPIVLELSGTKKDKDISDYFANGGTLRNLRIITRKAIAEAKNEEKLSIEHQQTF